MCAALATAPSASAWTPYGDLGIDGFPLNLAANVQGLGVNVEGNGFNEVFWFDEAGLNPAVYGEGARGFEVYGFVDREPTPVALGPLRGSGTAADPWLRTLVWRAGSPSKLEVSEELSYVNGRARFEVHDIVRNITSAPVRFKPSAPAHFIDSEPLVRSGPRRIGVRGPGQTAVLEEVSPWAHTDLDYFNFVYQKVREGTNFDDAYKTTPDDVAAGGQWDTTTLAPGESITYSTAYAMTDEILASPPGTERGCDTPQEVFVTTRFGEGGARPGAQIGWTLRRSNGAAGIESGVIRADSAGDARFAWTCQNDGIDYLALWLDLDEDGVLDPGEPGTGSQVVWKDPGTPAYPDNGHTDDDAAAAVGASPPQPAAGAAPVTTSGAAAATLRAPAMRLRTVARRGTRLRIVGRLAADATGKVRISWSAKGRRGGVSAAVRGGRFAATLRLGRAARARRVVVTVRYAGDATHAAQTIRRVLRRR